MMRAYILRDAPIPNLNLSAKVLHNNITFHRQDSNIKNDNENSPIPSLNGTEGDTISVGCRIENHTQCMTAGLYIVIHYVGGE